MRALASDGLSSVIMSVDAHDVQRHEQNRGLPDVCRKIRRANEVFAGLGIQTTASITASRLIDDYDKLPEFLRSLGFGSCTFSYPLTNLGSSYPCQRLQPGKLQNDELIQVFGKIKQMKRRSGFRGQPNRIAQRNAAPPKQPENLRSPGRPQTSILIEAELYRCPFGRR